LSAKHGLGKVRGRGLLQALDLKQPLGGAIVAAALDAGLILNAPRSDTLRFMPALNIAEAEVEQMLEMLDGVIAEMV
jgi:acetylornithine/N-succinyldiaminopimelate aminotransferase